MTCCWAASSFCWQKRELQPALVRGERLLERKLAAFPRHDFFQLGERLLEIELGGRLEGLLIVW